MMGWDLKPAREHFPAFAEAWDRLNAELYASHPMFDSRFVGSLLEHFGNGDELLCIHHGAGSVDGALIVRPRGRGRWALFLPSQAQAGAVMLKNAKLLETLLLALPGYAWSLDLLSIDPLYSPDWTQLGLPRIVMPHANTMAISTRGDFAAYWQARPKNLRHNISRYLRRAKQVAGAISVHCFTKPNEIAEALKRYGVLESAGWKGKGGTSIAPDNAQGRFYTDMLGRFGATGQAMVMELHAGERLVASRLFIGHPTMWIALKTTYDETQSAFAPGRLLLHDMIERAFNEIPDGSIEFYTNATRDQADWATSLRPIPHHQILRNEPIATALITIKSLPHRLAKNQNRNAFDPLQIHSFPNVSSLPPSALELFEQAETRYPEFAAGWFDNLHRSVFAEDPGMRYYVAERAGKAVAILPVRLARYGLVRRIEALGNFYTSLYSPILGEDATEVDLAALLETASRNHEGAHEMRFAPMDPEAPAFAATLAALRSIGWIPFRYFCFGNWHLPVSGSWQDYFQQREGQLRNTIKRKGKKFAAAGGTLEIITEPTQAEAAIADFIHVYSRSWKKPEPYPEFIPGLIRWLAAKGWLRLGIARLVGQPIAAQLWIVAHGKAYIYKLAYDEAHAQYAPGTLLTAHLMEHAIDRDRVREVDYMIGDDEYKKTWMSNRRERWGIVAINPRTFQGVLQLPKQIIGQVIRLMREKKEAQAG
ncbi:GNAT family N-acetyltransferase [Sulfuricystis multivorans]|uniref:GNAT family N-acetyltransferase n=1 Tax=Sulfuricystis multivorans TaxID=2211108 RepID=UPI0011CF02BF|nr:GNAT family N-acetyltransferase [Sulfuricystis multivorans]